MGVLAAKALVSTRAMILASFAAIYPVASVAQDTRAGQIIAMSRIAADIREAREVAKTVTDVRTRERLELLLSRAELAARDLQQAATKQQPAAPAQRPGAMPAEDFSRFLSALSANAFDDARLATVKTLGTARLSAAQGKQILEKFSFDKGREEAAVFIHPLLVDPHLFAVVLEAMSFEKSRAAVLKRIAP